MRDIYKFAVLVSMAIITGPLAISGASAYEAGDTGEAVVEGKMIFKGALPSPKLFPLAKYSNPVFCSQVDTDGKGNHLLREVAVNNGNLQDVVVYIKDINKGKPFTFNGTDIKIDHCRFQVQGGPSTFVGVVVDGEEIRVLNEDADPSDTRTADGVLHNPHGYEVQGETGYHMFNSVLPLKGGSITKQVKFKKPKSVMLLECDQHQYEQAWFYPVENPYYAIVGPEGTYAIDQVPAGKYKLVAWHPILGIQEKEIEVGATGKVTANFEFSKSTKVRE